MWSSAGDFPSQSSPSSVVPVMGWSWGIGIWGTHTKVYSATLSPTKLLTVGFATSSLVPSVVSKPVRHWYSSPSFQAFQWVTSTYVSYTHTHIHTPCSQEQTLILIDLLYESIHLSLSAKYSAHLVQPTLESEGVNNGGCFSLFYLLFLDSALEYIKEQSTSLYSLVSSSKAQEML